MVQMHLAAVPQQGEGEQGRHRRQPEQKVQKRAQKGGFDPHPQNPEQVINHPHGPAQQQSLAQRPALLGHIDGHPPSSRESSPPPRLPRSAS